MPCTRSASACIWSGDGRLRSGSSPSCKALCAIDSALSRSDGKRRGEVSISRLRRNVENEVGEVLPLYLIRGLGYALNGVERE